MSEASVETFKSLSRDSEGRISIRFSTADVVEWVRVHGPITAHDLCDFLETAGKIGRYTDGTVQEKGQVWSEFSARISEAAKLGLVDDDEVVPRINPRTGRKSNRSLYKHLPVPRGVRLNKSERLEIENEELRRQLDVLQAKFDHLASVFDNL